MVAYVEITRHTEDFDVALEATALFEFELFLDACEQSVAVDIAVLISLNFEQSTVCIHARLRHLAIVVNNVVAEVVFNVQPNNIAGHPWHLNVDVDVESVGRVRGLDHHVAWRAWLEVRAEFAHAEEN